MRCYRYKSLKEKYKENRALIYGKINYNNDLLSSIKSISSVNKYEIVEYSKQVLWLKIDAYIKSDGNSKELLQNTLDSIKSCKIDLRKYRIEKRISKKRIRQLKRDLFKLHFDFYVIHFFGLIESISIG